MNVPAAAARRFTSGALTVGVLVSAVCYLVALASDFAGNDSLTGDMTDVRAVIEGALAFAPWAWASLGTFAIVLTPVAGLLVTAYEYAAISDRRTMWLVIAVLVILAGSVVVAVLR